MSAIAAVSRNIKTMADGTLRLTIDIEPSSAQDAFKLFGMPDVPMAIARLTQESAQVAAQEETIEADKPRNEHFTGLCKLAIDWCADSEFANWLKFEGYGDGSKEYAKAYIYEICNIESRKELNTNKAAAAIFDAEIRGPYMQYIFEQGRGQQ